MNPNVYEVAFKRYNKELFNRTKNKHFFTNKEFISIDWNYSEFEAIVKELKNES